MSLPSLPTESLIVINSADKIWQEQMKLNIRIVLPGKKIVLECDNFRVENTNGH